MPRSLPLNQYDPWPTRLTIAFIGLIGLGGLGAIVAISFKSGDIQGLVTIPVTAITVLSMLLSRRPPWTAPGERPPGPPEA